MVLSRQSVGSLEEHNNYNRIHWPSVLWLLWMPLTCGLRCFCARRNFSNFEKYPGKCDVSIFCCHGTSLNIVNTAHVRFYVYLPDWEIFQNCKLSR
jgi:hypothetical protein